MLVDNMTLTLATILGLECYGTRLKARNEKK